MKIIQFTCRRIGLFTLFLFSFMLSSFILESKDGLLKSYPDCTPPENLAVEISNENEVIFSWEGDRPSKKTHFYKIRYQTFGSTNWIEVEEKNRTKINISELDRAKGYRFEVQKICFGTNLDEDLTSDWIGVDLKALETRGDAADSLCALVTHYEAQPYQSGIMVLWEGPAAQMGQHIYKVGYKRTISTTWTYVEVTNGDQYYIDNLIEEELYDLSLQYFTFIGEFDIECETVFMGPVLVTRPTTTEGEDEEPEITLPEFECGEIFQLPEITNEVPLGFADTMDLFFIGGFPIKLKEVYGGAGQFSGEGIVPLPFSEKTVSVVFTNVSVNENYEIFLGEVIGVADDVANYPEIPYEPFSIGGDICQPLPDSAGFDEGGLYQPGNSTTDPNGFGPDGTYTEQPPYPGYEPGDPFDPNYDPNGFGPDGTYLGTGSPYNPEGCSQQGLTADNQPCDPTGDGPYFWLEEDPTSTPPTQGGIVLVNTIDSLLMDIIIACLDSLETEARDSMESAGFICDQLKKDVDDILLTKKEIGQITGDTEQYTKRGMHQQFSTAPEILPATSNSRQQSQIDLEQKHVDLYNCDKRLHKFIYWSEIITLQYAEPDISNCEAILKELAKRLPDAEATLYVNDHEALKQWVYKEIDKKVYQELIGEYGEEYGINDQIKKSFNIPFGSSAPGFYTPIFSASYASNKHSVLDMSEDALAEFSHQFMQGDKFINNTHRAFFLDAISTQRSAVLTEENTSLLPIVVSKVVAGKEQTLLIDNIIFNPTGARLDAYFILEPPNSESKAVFELANIGFGPTGFPDGDTPTLNLVNEINIRLSNAAQLNILGGGNTFVAVDCEGFAGMGIEAEVEFCRNYLLPLDPESMEIILVDSVNVKARFIAEMPAWGDFIADLTFDPFALANAPDTKFTVTGAKLDLSDAQTVPGIVFPPNYSSPFVSGSTPSHLWKGFYLQELSITLPNKFSDDNEPITGGMNNVIIDGMGFTGEAFLSPILSLDKGNLGGWAFSIDEFRLGVVANRIKGGSLSGLINVPLLSSAESNSDEVSEADCLSYIGSIDANNTYAFTVSPNQNYAAKLWKANVELDASSTVTIALENDEFVAKAMLNGRLSIDSDFSSSINVKVPDIPFSGLTVSNTQPYLSPGTWELPTELGVNFAGFGAYIKNPRAVTLGGNDVGLNFSVGIRLNHNENDVPDPDEPSLSAEGNICVVGEMIETNGRQKWKYKDIDIKEFCMGAGGMKMVKRLRGCLAFYDEEDWTGPVNWGTGFRGMLDADLDMKKLSLNLQVVGQFGNIKSNGDPFKYFMVDGLAVLNDGIKMGPLSLHGFGGGVTFNMAKQGTPGVLPEEAPSSPILPGIGTSLSGTQFFPDKAKSLGVFANVVMASTGNSDAFNFNATLGAEFNDEGGFSQLYFQGNARFMSDMELTAPPNYNPNGGNPLNGADISAFVDLKMDFGSGVFDGTFDVFANVGNGAIIGAKEGGPQYYFGGCEMSFGAETGWFVNLGKPSKKNLLRVQIPNVPKVGIDFASYLNIGTDIEPMPSPPHHVMQLTGASNFMANESRRGTGNGFAFGASLDFDTGPLKYLIFYSRFQAGLGFDINLQKYASAHCVNLGSDLGINGWYASGQAWGYFSGEIGLRAKVWGEEREFVIIDLGAAAIVQAKLPRPFWAKAAVGGRYNILGGLIKGDCRFKVTIGKTCQLEAGEELTPEFPIFVDVSPNDGQKDVSTLVQPEITFGIPIGEPFEADGKTYELKLDFAKVQNQNGEEIPFKKSYSEDNLGLTLTPYYELTGGDSLVLTAQVSVLSNGELVDTKSREHEFVTADRLAVIPLDNIASSYPIHGQYNYFKHESLIGGQFSRFFIHLKTAQPSLLHNPPPGKYIALRVKKDDYIYKQIQVTPGGEEIKVVFGKDFFENGKYYDASIVYRDIPPSSNNGGVTTTTGSSNQSGLVDGNGSRAVLREYEKERPYPRKVVNRGRDYTGPNIDHSLPGQNNSNENSAPADEILLTLSFRVSNYNSFAAKMDDFFNQASNLSNESLVVQAANFEPFDKYESTLTEMGDPLMKVFWNPNYKPEVWFENIQENLYDYLPYYNVNIFRDPTDLPIYPSWAASFDDGAFADPVFAPTFGEYLIANSRSYQPSITLNPFAAVRNDIKTIQFEVKEYVTDELCEDLIHQGENYCETVNNLFWLHEPQWVKDYYKKQNIDPVIKPGVYGGFINYKLPGLPTYRYNFTITK